MREVILGGPGPDPAAATGRAPGGKVYRGFRVQGEAFVTVAPPGGGVLPLLPGDSLKIRDHSPTGFNWGYHGSGPAQLALAILLDATGDAERALDQYQAFKWDVVSRFKDEWSVTEAEVLAWLAGRPIDPPPAADEPHDGLTATERTHRKIIGLFERLPRGSLYHTRGQAIFTQYGIDARAIAYDFGRRSVDRDEAVAKRRLQLVADLESLVREMDVAEGKGGGS